MIDFSDPGMMAWLEKQAADQFDQMPFGIVRMTHEGIVVDYNKFETDSTGIAADYAVGKHFFTQIAPCANNYMVAARYAQPVLDQELNYIITYVTRPTKVRLRLLKSPDSPHQYFLVKRT